MTEEIDWTLATWEGTRRRQHREFRALSFREKVRVLEQLDEVARALAAGVRTVHDGYARDGERPGELNRPCFTR